MTPLYFVPPTVDRPTPEGLERLGLSHLVDGPDRMPVHCPVQRGPSGEAGVILQMPYLKPKGEVEDNDAAYYPDDQEWVEVPRGDLPTIWIGWLKGQRPGWEDLKRKTELRGHVVPTLGGACRPALAQEWVSEGAEELHGFSPALPTPLAYDPKTGWRSGDVLPVYRDYYERALRQFEWFYDAFRGDHDGRVEYDDAFAFAVEALAWNYRVSVWELGPLSLLSPQEALDVAEAACDWTSYEPVLQKKIRAILAQESSKGSGPSGPSPSDSDSPGVGAADPPGAPPPPTTP